MNGQNSRESEGVRAQGGEKKRFLVSITSLKKVKRDQNGTAENN